MKNSFLLWRRLAITMLAAALTGVPGILISGENALQTPAAAPVAKPTGSEPQTLQIVGGELILPQGKVTATLPNVVDALRDQYPGANIVLSPGLAKLRVGDLKLRAGRLLDELEAVRIASGEKFEVQPPNGPTQIDPNTGLAMGVSTGLFVLREAKPTAQSQPVVAAFNIGPYIDWLRQEHPDQPKGSAIDSGIANVKSIISQTLESFSGGGETPPSFQYHSGANLLIIIGNAESVEIARKIINVLPGMSSIAQESRTAFGLDAADSPSEAGRTRQERAEDAFRRRYGMLPRSATPGQPTPGSPNAGSQK